MIFYFSLSFLIFAFGAQIILRSFSNGAIADYSRKFYKYIFFFSILLVFSFLFYDSWQQYNVWLNNEISRFFLPPYTGIGYFLFYVGVRFFGPYSASLILAFLFFVVAKYLNKKYQERFFYKEEFYVGALAIFLIGYPLAIFYLIGVISIFLLAQFVFASLSKNFSQRLSSRYLWLPIAIFVIIIKSWIQISPWWKMLKF